MYTAGEYPREGSKRWGVFCDWSRTWVLFGRKSVMKKKADELNKEENERIQSVLQ